MKTIECFLCLENKKEFVKCIKIGSPTWIEEHIESVIEKHLWPMVIEYVNALPPLLLTCMYQLYAKRTFPFITGLEEVDEKFIDVTFLKSNSRWLCLACWEVLHDFHDFYIRVKNSNECYDYLVKSERDVPIDEHVINDSMLNALEKPPDGIITELFIDEQNEEEHLEDAKTNDVAHETIILKDGIIKNKTSQQSDKLDDNEEGQTKNPLELCKSNVVTAAKTTRSSKHFVAKYYKFKCDLCEEPFNTFATLQKHFCEVHKQEAYVMCCGTKFKSRSVFGEHIKIHMDPDSFKCKYCLKKLKNKRNLAIHIARLHEGNYFHCHVCNKKFIDELKYQEHKTEHEDILQDCDDVDESSADQKENENEFIVMENNIPNKLCHSDIETESNDVTSQLNCIPKETNSNEDNARVPNPNTMEVEEHLIDCFSYDSDNSQSEQMQTSSLEKAEETHVANLELTIQGYLRVNSKFTCDICEAPCESFNELRDHFAKHHADQKVYVICCGEQFKSRNCLSEHIKSHLIPGCYQCQYCKKVLKNNRNLRAHIKRWHADKTYLCDLCDLNFFSDTEYKEHASLHHVYVRVENLHSDSKSIINNSEDNSEKKEQIEQDTEEYIVRLHDEEEDDIVYDNDESLLHYTHGHDNAEMSVEVTLYNDNGIPQGSHRTSSKFIETAETTLNSLKTTPEELMEFDDFLKEHHKFTCHECDDQGETYENFVKLRQHFAHAHKMEGYVHCCGAKFIRRRALVDHIKGHLDPDYLKCTYCARVLRDRRGLMNHLALHEGKVQRCDVCKKKFYDPAKYESHKLTHAYLNENEDSRDSDDLPLIYRMERMGQDRIKNVEIEKEKKELQNDHESDHSTAKSKPLPDFSKNLQRQLEHDEFLAKHFKIVCPICEDQTKAFKSFALLKNHFALEHNEDAYLICCAYKFKKRDSLVQHIKTHLNPQEFTCEFCSKVLKTKRNLRYHIAACHEGKEFRCDICKKKFIEESSFKRHRKTHKPNDNTNFPCPECGRTYKIKHKLNHHINTFHRHRYARLCDICGSYFRDINLFNAHMKSRHVEDSEKEKFPCEVCGRIMAARASLRLHMKTQHPENDTYAFTCQICSKPMATRGLLNYHIRMTHKKIKPHKCNVCGKAYKELKQLRGHMGIHTGESLFKCNFCPKTFNSTGNRSTHRKKVHPKEWEEFQKKMYIQNMPTKQNT